MSTRVKIFISYLIMGIVPLILFLGILSFTVLRTVTSNPFLMNVNDNHESFIKCINRLSGLEILAQENPEGLFDKDMLTDIDKITSEFRIGIVLVDGEKEQFFASGILEGKDLVQKITSSRITNQFGSRKHFESEPSIFPNYYRLNVDSDYLVLGRELERDVGMLYIVVEAEPTEHISDKLPERFLNLLFLGTLGLIVLMTFLVTRGMMQSLKTLKNGVRHISDGDLDFSIKTRKRDEVAQVVNAFDEMRLRLKASIDAQVREDESRRELVANISHDLRTPVTAIKGYIEGLIDGMANTPEKRDKYMSTILSKTIALDRMIDDLFLYSSLDVGKANYHFDNVPALDFFKSFCNETKLDLEEKGFNVQCIIEIPTGITVRLDRSMIQRLQHNLTENAVKYCKESGRRVIFSAGFKDGAVVCSTEDNGTGIQADALPNIFERFYRADAARTSTIGGTGLGLQISKRIVEDHGGIIWAESIYGEFTRISWTLPVEAGTGGALAAGTGTDVVKTGEAGTPGAKAAETKTGGARMNELGAADALPAEAGAAGIGGELPAETVAAESETDGGNTQNA